MTDTLNTVEIVEFAPCSVWIESDMFGARHVMLHHQGHGEPFTYATFNYDYAYTSNAQTRHEAEKLAIALGAKVPVQEKVREWKMPAELSELTRERTARQEAQRQVTDLQERIARAGVEMRSAMAAERERISTALLAQADHIRQNGMDVAKYGGNLEQEGRCRELCSTYLREFAQNLQSASAIREGAPAREQPKQEPVASVYVTQDGDREFDDWRCPLPVGRNLLYTKPPAREWRGLTDEEIGALTVFEGLHHVEVPLLATFARAIEAALKARNA